MIGAETDPAGQTILIKIDHVHLMDYGPIPIFVSLRFEQALNDRMDIINKQINANFFINYPPN